MCGGAGGAFSPSVCFFFFFVAHEQKAIYSSLRGVTAAGVIESLVETITK